MNPTKRNKMLSVRVSDEEILLIKQLTADLMRQHHYVKESNVIRELIGFEDNGLIKPEHRRQLRPMVQSEQFGSSIFGNDDINFADEGEMGDGNKAGSKGNRRLA